MEWISDKETAELLGIRRQTLADYRKGSKKKKGGKVYEYPPKFPPEAWRYTNRIEFDKDFILKFKAGK